MKMRRLVIPLLWAGCATSQPRPVQAWYDEPARVEVYSVADFYEPLAEHGYWVYVEPHGWGWYPANVSRNWQPYAVGHWVWTDEDWYWVSDEPWAWACYHYGRWFWHPAYGWTWAPGTEWAPAWVAWREGGDYVGWAPLGYDPDPNSGYVFIERRRFCDPLTPAVIVHEHHHYYTTLINQTVIVRRDRAGHRPGPATVRDLKHRVEQTPQDRPVVVRPIQPQTPSPGPERKVREDRSRETVTRERPAQPPRAEKPVAVRPEAAQPKAARPAKSRSAVLERVATVKEKKERRVED